MRMKRIAFGVWALTVAACGTDSATDPQPVATWHGGIHALLVEKCGGCHTDGGAGPFPLDDYDSAVEMSGRALGAVEDGIMPPWGAQDTDECAPTRPWKDDLRLSDAERALLREWVLTDTPLGDPATAIDLPQRPSLEITDPTVSRTFQTAFTVMGHRPDVFECFVLDPGITEKAWITAAQVTPGTRTIAHHALVFLDKVGASEALATDGHFPCFSNPDIDGSLIAAWAPGAVPATLPEGAGIPIKPGARIVVQMHYHAAAQAEIDQSSVQLSLTNTQPEYEAALALLGNFSKLDAAKNTGLMPGPNDGANGPEFLIPAGVRGHTETMVYKHLDVPIAVPVFSVGAHMHYVGTDMRIERTFADGSADRECLLQTPKWDFNWQRTYRYDVPIEELPTIGAGDEIVMRCTYDNSMNNEFVVDALKEQGLEVPVPVQLGEQTLDEMCLGVFGVLAPAGLIDLLDP